MTDVLAHVAVLGAAGGLGQGILRVCRSQGVGFTAIVRSRPDRIEGVPPGSRVAVVADLGDRAALSAAFAGAQAVLTATGVTRTSQDESALLSANLDSVEGAMNGAGVDRIVIMNTLVTSGPGEKPTLLTRVLSWLPGRVGRGAADLQAVPVALGQGALQSVRWTLVRGAVNSRGKHVPPVAALQRGRQGPSLWPVSYDAMARWMLDEATASRFVRQAPFVSRPR